MGVYYKKFCEKLITCFALIWCGSHRKQKGEGREQQVDLNMCVCARAHVCVRVRMWPCEHGHELSDSTVHVWDLSPYELLSTS
jgi:hypothetical protein